ncbi:MAG: hypothetical protein FWD28_04260 [Treponema sp.]|nr:hypothetical protein [Treponema sp.]
MKVKVFFVLAIVLGLLFIGCSSTPNCPRSRSGGCSDWGLACGQSRCNVANWTMGRCNC